MKLMLLVGLTACSASATAKPPAGEAMPAAMRKLPAPAHLPSVARALLSERMATHGQDVSDLMWAMLFLDDQSVREIAENIAQQPRIARPTTYDATELSSQLPTSFFDLQDRLAATAEKLAKDAAARDLDAMATSYGELTATCVRCHAAYLTEPPSRAAPPGAEEEGDEEEEEAP